MKKKQIAITLGTMCLILVFAIMIQLKTTKNVVSTVGQSFKENGLKDEVLKCKEKYDSSYRQLEEAQKQLEQERQKSVSNNTSSIDKQTELKKLNTVLGSTDVTGEGISITIKDNVTGSTIGSINDLIHDGDLRTIVNELQNAGAEAISINGQRIVSSTAITCVGTVIQVNNEKVGTPFVIKAIGNQASLVGGMTRAGGFLELLKYTYGIPTEVKKSNDISISKYNGVLTDKYIENVE